MKKIAFALAGAVLLAAPAFAADPPPPLDPRCFIMLCDPPPPPPPLVECELPSPDDCSPPADGCPVAPECDPGS
ncbi:MAG TPA: hypothetical protein VFR28_03475 [Allosphingosinicella sp.]|jgi:hypothetical protein|nr:hypothetical protein [Allosphingosinicella sp.]